MRNSWPACSSEAIASVGAFVFVLAEAHPVPVAVCVGPSGGCVMISCARVY
jgi:hypothetical protein